MRKIKAREPEVRAYMFNILAEGGTITSLQLDAVNKFVYNLKYKYATNIWDKQDIIGLMAGSDMLSSFVKLKYPSGHSYKCVNHAFIEGDYSALGLKCGNRAGTWLQTGYTFTGAGRAGNDQSMHVSLTTVSGVSGIALSTSDSYVARAGNYATLGGVLISNATLNLNLNSISTGASNTKSYLRGAATSTPGAAGSTTATGEMLIGKFGGGEGYTFNGTIAGYSAGGYLTPTEVQQLSYEFDRFNVANSRITTAFGYSAYFGDSIIFSGTWVNPFDAWLGDSAVLNQGISSSTLQNTSGNPSAGYTRYPTDILATFPRRFIINYGVNDSFNYSGLSNENVITYENQFILMMRDAINSGISKEWVIIGSPYCSSDASFASFGNGNTRANQEAYMEAAKRVCRKFQVKYAATYEAMLANGAAAGSIQTDGIHPTPTGYNIIDLSYRAAALLT